MTKIWSHAYINLSINTGCQIVNGRVDGRRRRDQESVYFSSSLLGLIVLFNVMNEHLFDSIMLCLKDGIISCTRTNP